MCQRKASVPVVAESPQHEVIIIGGGLVGFVLALALEKYTGRKVPVFERSATMLPNVGAGLVLQQNGLKVLRDIDETLYEAILQASSDFTERTWERHDGTVIAAAPESNSRGIQRWRLQNLLHEAVCRRGINVHWGKELTKVDSQSSSEYVRVHFADGTHTTTAWLMASDGVKSKVRRAVVPDVEWHYSGWTSFMGISHVESSKLRMPSSLTTKCHATFFPTGDFESCFQIHFPLSSTNPECWGTLTCKRSAEMCQKLANELEADGWDESFLHHLKAANRSVQVGFGELKPPLKNWVYGRVVLLGDAAHPPHPFLGQGSQQGYEDAATLALLIEQFGLTAKSMELYETIRMSRVDLVAKCDAQMGDSQQRRASSSKLAFSQEDSVQRQIFFHETSPLLLAGAAHDYRQAIRDAIEPRKL
jgi:salicylate hydroxylase